MAVQSIDGVHGEDITQNCGFVNGKYASVRSAITHISWHEPTMNLAQEIFLRITELEPNMAELARKAGIAHDQVSRFFKGTRTNYKDVAAMLEGLGARIMWPGEHQELTREVCWVDAKIVPAGNGQQLPPPENYFAVPLVGETGAGPGIMPTDEIKSWVLVYRHQHAVQFKSDLLAVEVDKQSTSMSPLLRPGDIVLVDREDKKPSKPGGIFLVREPGQQGGTMIKRVATKSIDGDTLVTFYSENAAENPADTYNLRVHYDGEISKAIVGRCVWAWSDITGK